MRAPCFVKARCPLGTGHYLWGGGLQNGRGVGWQMKSYPYKKRGGGEVGNSLSHAGTSGAQHVSW